MKYILLFLVAAFCFAPAQGLTGIPFSNTTHSGRAYIEYENMTVDSEYQLDSRDSFKKTEITLESNIYPNTQIYSFTDISGNILSVQYITTMNASWYLWTEYTVTEIVSYNGVIQELVDNGDSLGFSYTFTDTVILDNHLQEHRIVWGGNVLNLQSNSAPAPPIFSTYNVDVEIETGFYPTNIIIPADNNKKILFQYMETYKKQLINSIDQAYSDLNFIFQLFFQIGKGLTWISKTLGFVSENDYLEWQSYLLLPLQLFDVMLKLLISAISFLMVMGITFSILFVECIIFIFSYLKTKRGSLIDTISNWSDLSISFWTRTIIRPLTWVFEKLVRIWA